MKPSILLNAFEFSVGLMFVAEVQRLKLVNIQQIQNSINELMISQPISEFHTLLVHGRIYGVRPLPWPKMTQLP